MGLTWIREIKDFVSYTVVVVKSRPQLKLTQVTSKWFEIPPTGRFTINQFNGTTGKRTAKKYRLRYA